MQPRTETCPCGSVSRALHVNVGAYGVDTLAYDQANRLQTANVGGATSTYAYDGDGKRASKTVGGNTTAYVYDANRSLPVVLGAHNQAFWMRSAG